MMMMIIIIIIMAITRLLIAVTGRQSVV